LKVSAEINCVQESIKEWISLINQKILWIIFLVLEPILRSFHNIIY
jgi:hypothetical protein